MGIGGDILVDAVAEALDGHRCVSGWLGRANVLFLGFGSAPVRARTGDGLRTEPPYEVNVNRADRRLEGDGLSACPEDPPDQAEQAVTALVGRPVRGWSLATGHALAIEFDGGLTVRIDPWVDPDESRWDAWSVALPKRLVAVSCGGRVASVDPECPVGQWFDDQSPATTVG
jgi:hypothetical protein